MAGRIPQSFIEDLIDRVDILDFISSRLEIKKAGKNHVACCPFHQEKSPSFTVAQDKQFYYCFGCGATGNVLKFIMEFDHLDFLPALELLAQHAGIAIPQIDDPNRQEDRSKREIYSILNDCDRFFRRRLRQHEISKDAINYMKGRGISGKVAAKFGIGYAPQGWDNLIKEEGGDRQRLALLERSGMLVHRPDEKKRYDRFRHRIVFPIRDQRGRTVGFGGRVLDESKPKYLNSPETAVFQKARELYGLYEARRASNRLSELIIVEGYMDVISLAQFGIINCVATLGTAITDQHVKKIFRNVSDIIFCFDGDHAGRRAAARAIDTVLPQMNDGLSARFLFLPDAEDPDTMVRTLGKEAFLEMVANALPLSEFFFSHYSADIDTSTPDGKAKLAKSCAPQINKIPEGIFKKLMLAKLSELTGVLTNDLHKYLEAYKVKPNLTERDPEIDRSFESPDREYPEYYHSKSQNFTEVRHTYQPAEKKILFSPIKYLIGLLINFPQLLPYATDTALMEKSSDSEIELFLELTKTIKDNPDFNPSRILKEWQADRHLQNKAAYIKPLVAHEIYHSQPNSERDNISEFCDALNHIRCKMFDTLPDSLKAQHLLKQDVLNEKEIKQLHNIYITLSEDVGFDGDRDLKNAIKQRLVGDQRYNK